MKVGDLVNYTRYRELNSYQKNLKGIITSIRGKKWVEVSWIDKLITREHVNDLEIFND